MAMTCLRPSYIDNFGTLSSLRYLLLVLLLSFYGYDTVFANSIYDNSTTGVIENNFIPACEVETWKVENDVETVVLLTTDGWHCNLLVTGNTTSRIAVRMLEFSHDNSPQYLYVERDGDYAGECNHKFLVYHQFQSSCVTIFEHESLRFHIKANMTLEIKTIYNDKGSGTHCPENETRRRCTEQSICSKKEHYCNNVLPVNNVSVCKFQHKFEKDEYEYKGRDGFKNGTKCEMHCPDGCDCALYNRELKGTNCPRGVGSDSTWTNRLLYPPDTKLLYLAHNQLGVIKANAFRDLRNLERLHLHSSNVTSVEKGAFKGLDHVILLTLSYSKGMKLNPGSLSGLSNLQELYLENNDFHELTPSVYSGLDSAKYLFLRKNNFHHFEQIGIRDLNKLRVLDLSNNSLRDLPSDFCKLFPDIFYLALANNSLQKLSARMFQDCTKLETLNLNGNPLKWISKDTFVGLTNVTKVLVENYYTCCFVTNASCTPLNDRPEFLTCKRLLPHGILRVCMWILGICALFGNAMVIYWRCREKQDANKVQSILIMNLSLSDFLMGVYMMILTCADAYFREYFPSHADAWRSGSICKIAGLVAMLSSEGSVFFLVLISIDRLIGVKYPFSTRRLKKKSTRIVATILWGIALIISMIATLLSGTDYYDVSEVCIGLPLARKPLTRSIQKNVTITDNDDRHKIEVETLENIGHKPGMYFSIAIFIGINFICFVAIALCYTIIFVTFHESTRRSVRRQERDEEIKMAGKMAVIVITDFLCWMPIVIMSMMVQTGAVTLSPEMYAWTVTFILPINSSVNPFLYTIATVVSSRLALRKTRIYNNPTMTTQHT